MTIDKMIDTLTVLKGKVGGDEEVPVVRIDYGENDYIIPDFAVCGNFCDQDGNEFKCALVGSEGGEEFAKTGTGHYNWNAKTDIVKV